VNPDPWAVGLDDLVGFLARPGWKRETRKSVRATVRAFYKWAVTTGRLSENPARGLPPLRAHRGLPRPTPDDVLAVALARGDARDRAMILLAALAGLRCFEIATLRDECITEAELRIVGKGGKERVIPLHPVLRAALDEAARYRVRFFRTVDCDAGWVFPGKCGHLLPNEVSRRLGELLGPGYTAHGLRHRFATLAYAVERDRLAVQRLLGHSKPETTTRVRRRAAGGDAAGG
jgi:integrase